LAQLPIDKIHLGSGICSYNRLKTGAILLVNVPATIIKSECLGEALKIIPNLSISYRLTAACIISTAQQANPKVSGHKEPDRAQAIIDINFDDIHSSFKKKKKLNIFFIFVSYVLNVS
jgi:hypothetical protein